MKKLLFAAILLMGAATLFTSCGGKKGTDAATSVTTPETAAPATDAQPSSGGKVDQLFGGNLFWGASHKMTKADADQISIPGAETAHEKSEKSYTWMKENRDGSSWQLDLTFNKKDKLESMDFAYDLANNSDGRAFAKELLKAIEAKNGKHTNDDTTGDTDFDWDNDDYVIYMFAPEAGSEDVRVSYTESALE